MAAPATAPISIHQVHAQTRIRKIGTVIHDATMNLNAALLALRIAQVSDIHESVTTYPLSHSCFGREPKPCFPWANCTRCLQLSKRRSGRKLGSIRRKRLVDNWGRVQSWTARVIHGARRDRRRASNLGAPERGSRARWVTQLS